MPRRSSGIMEARKRGQKKPKPDSTKGDSTKSQRTRTESPSAPDFAAALGESEVGVRIELDGVTIEAGDDGRTFKLWSRTGEYCVRDRMAERLHDVFGIDKTLGKKIAEWCFAVATGREFV